MASRQQSDGKLSDGTPSEAAENRQGSLDRAGVNLAALQRVPEGSRLVEAKVGSLPDNQDILETEDGCLTLDLPPIQSPGLFEAGQVVAGRFVINRYITRGGMGEVYEAWDSEVRERVALKTIRPELASISEVLERFRREVRQARGISHPNVCRVHELFCHEPANGDRIWFLSMEFLEGFNLCDYLRHHGPMNPAAAFELVGQIIDGLIAAHSMGVIHRDLKTANIMLVSASPGTLRVVVTDFGLALNVFKSRSGLQEPGGQGTPAFMAPEQKETGEVSFLADQFALGMVMCEILTGSRPIRSHSISSSAKPSIQLPDKPLPPLWRRAILRCLQTRPEDRFKSMEEVRLALAPRKRLWRIWIWPTSAAICALALSVGLVRQPRIGPTSLAVLPLHNDTGNASLDYLGAGISEALTNDLSRMPSLQVTAESVARLYRGDNVDPRAAGRTLHVGSVVNGSFSNPNGVLRVPIELVDVKTGRQVWGQTYESTTSSVADLQHEISTDVAYRLKIKLDENIKARLQRQYSTNAAAYDAYLKGRFHLAQRSPDALQEAVGDFDQALDRDPQYAPADAGLADCYSLLAYYGLQTPIPSLTKALAAAQKGLEIDSTLGEAYTSRALARTFLNFEWQGAEEDYRRALELNPNYLTAHTWFAMALLVPLGRQAEASTQMGYTQAADPDSLVTITDLAAMYYFAGNSDKTISLIEPRIRSFSHFESAFQILADAYLAKNMNEKVITVLESNSLSPEIMRQRAVPLGIAYARMGQRKKALAMLKIAESNIRDGYFRSYDTATLYSALNDRGKALDMLELAYARRESDLVFLNVDPLTISLRSEPRFVRLLGLMNIH
jgi:serine/threonine protein kinase/tetratricopeptide (TPR) repeat protein